MATIADRLNKALSDLLANDKRSIVAQRNIMRELSKMPNASAKDIERIILKYDKTLMDKAKLYVVVAQVRSMLVGVDVGVAILALASIYNPKAPNLFVKKIYDMSKGKVANRAKNLLKEVELKNETNITRTLRSNIRQKVKGVSQTYKTLNKALEKGLDPEKVLRETNVEWKVKRVIRTESHEQFEIANVDVHKAMGLTHKVWNTQGDKIVRDTPFHNAVGDKRIPIDSQFRANGIRADHPGDMMLPVGERINCRCYLTFE